MTGSYRRINYNQLVAASDTRQLSSCLDALALVESIEQTHFNGSPDTGIQTGLFVGDIISTLRSMFSSVSESRIT